MPFSPDDSAAYLSPITAHRSAMDGFTPTDHPDRTVAQVKIDAFGGPLSPGQIAQLAAAR